jgi:hypothetical protein
VDLADVGRLALTHSGVKRKGTESRPAWYVDDRLVARLLDPTSVVIRSDFPDRERLVADHPDTFSVPPRFESHMMVVAELGPADVAAVARAITEAVELQRRR